ncbi:uncharacterized protein LOC116209854 [Punica granatum]|nr:uncharacterized protein LOC116209854 [Punica granatum]
MQNHSLKVGSAKNGENPPKISLAASPEVEPSIERRSTHQRKGSKSKQMAKILTGKPAVHQSDPHRKVESLDQSPGSKTVDINDRVSDYISRAKLRIRAMSVRGGGKAKVEKEPGSSNRFADYIRRTKIFLFVRLQSAAKFADDDDARNAISSCQRAMKKSSEKRNSFLKVLNVAQDSALGPATAM